MKSDEITETIELDELAKYFKTYNLAVIKTKWIEDKSTGLKKFHVWTEEKQNEGGD